MQLSKFIVTMLLLVATSGHKHALADTPIRMFEILPPAPTKDGMVPATNVVLKSANTNGLLIDSKLIAAIGDSLETVVSTADPLWMDINDDELDLGTTLTIETGHSSKLEPGRYAELLSVTLLVGDELIEASGYRYFEAAGSGTVPISMEQYAESVLAYEVGPDGQLAVVARMSDPVVAPASSSESIDPTTIPPAVQVATAEPTGRSPDSERGEP